MSQGAAEAEGAIEARWGAQAPLASTIATAVYSHQRIDGPPFPRARMTINHGGGVANSIGESSKTRYIGIVTVDIFAPHGSWRPLMTAADELSSIFHRVQLTPSAEHTIRFRDATAVRKTREESLNKVSFDVPFWRDY